MKVPGRKEPSTRWSGEGGELKLSSEAAEEGEEDEMGEEVATALDSREPEYVSMRVEMMEE